MKANYLHVIFHFTRAVARKLNPDCRHVLARIIPFHVERCGEPSDATCARMYCAEHCYKICGVYAGDDKDGDELAAEPYVWEPKKQENGKEVVES